MSFLKEINNELNEFIKNQKIFFVGTAANQGSVNISPKGTDTFRIISPTKIIWLNLTGSGNETAAHLIKNNRMTIMFCSFEKKPLILRLYGNAKIYHSEEKEFQNKISLFPEIPGARQIIELEIDMVQTSCGFAVPFMEFKGERNLLNKWSGNQGSENLKKYWEEKNHISIDGFKTKKITSPYFSENKTKAVIFDMDGVIIDSEPLWKIAIINVMKQEGFDFTIEMCNRTKGMRMDEVALFWKNELNASFDPKIINSKVVTELIKLVKQQGKEINGLKNLLEYIKAKELKIALASSSAMQIINVVLEKLAIKHYFEIVHSAENEAYGKPHPQVFITTATKLSLKPEECLVIEDSLHGVIAGKSAKMKVIAMPEIGEPKINKFSVADWIVNSLEEIKEILK